MTEKNFPLLKRLRTRFLRMRHPQHFRMEQIAVKTGCGASGCMIYHTLDLAGYGIRLKPENERDLDSEDAQRSDYEFFTPGGRKVAEPYNAAARLLGLSTAWNSQIGNDEAGDLFEDFSLKTPKQAAKRIEQIIAEG